MASGGYRQPGSPAPVSGPGALSKRTDGPMGGGSQPVRAPSGGAYGERQELEQLQQAAPVAASPGGVASGAPTDVAADVIGLGEPSQRPDEPVTAGAAMGAGPGLESLGLPNQPGDDMKALLPYLPVLESMANRPGASRASRNLVRQLKGMA